MLRLAEGSDKRETRVHERSGTWYRGKGARLAARSSQRHFHLPRWAPCQSSRGLGS